MPQPLGLANAGLRILGADVAKDAVVFHDNLTGRGFSLDNRPEALRQGLTPYAGHDWLICETTGGYERALLEAAAAVGLTACRADAARVKAFIASHGARAKTDRIDAAWLSRYGLERAARLTPWRAPAAEREALGELVRHRQDLLAQRTCAKNRRSAPGGAVLLDLLDQQIAFLTAQIARIDAQIDELLKAHAQMARDEAALRAIPGVGPVCARTLIALLPELGRLGPKQAASLAGLAPHPRDPGQIQRRRRMTAGRNGLKPTLFMAALAATRAHPHLRLVYQRLINAGKPKRLAIAAIARKLVVIANAVIRDTSYNNSQLT